MVFRSQSWTLTDVASDVHVESLSLSNETIRLATPHDWSIRKRTLHGGLRAGIEVIEVHNGALSFTVLPTRGMGLWRGSYRGNFLGWNAPVLGPVHPKFVNVNEFGGIGWLAGFDEWLCRCGLNWNGPPGDDQGKKLTLHGRIANLPAHHVSVSLKLDDPQEISVTGQVEEAGLFLTHLRLTTTYTTRLGSHRLIIHDEVENCQSSPAELQLLYHCNVGEPFLEKDSRILCPIREMAPLTKRAAEGIDTYDRYAAPASGYAEQVYVHDLLADGNGATLALLHNAAANRGLVLRFNRNELPCFTVWKNTAAQEDGYVTGIEPATNFPNFKSFEREQGRVHVLPAGGKWSATWAIEIHDSADGVTGVRDEIAKLQATEKPVIHRQPRAGWSIPAV
ncbi:MAG: aldose 1-epimerase family protein [Gemmataceae bacterium]